MNLIILASTWNNGVFVLDEGGLSHEIPGRTVRGLSHDLAGGAYAAVDDRLEKVGAGLPNWLAGIVDTSCIASNGDDMALVSAGGEVFTSTDSGHNWRKKQEAVAGVSSVLIVRS